MGTKNCSPCGASRKFRATFQKFGVGSRMKKKEDGNDPVPKRADMQVNVDGKFFESLSGKSGDDGLLAWMDKHWDQEVAVIVSDLSGFTSTTRKWGIVHFASVIARKRQLCLPIAHRRGQLHIGTEADNLMIVFADVSEAVKAAVEMKHAIDTYNEALSEERAHFKIKLNGIGVHCGAGLVLDKEDNMHGEAFRGAYHLGEDICEEGKVLISGRVKDKIVADPFFESCTFPEFEEEAFDGFPFEVDGSPGPLLDEQEKFDDARYLHPSLVDLCRRHDPSLTTEALEAFDTEQKKAKITAHTVLMLNIDLSENGDGASVNLEHAMTVKFAGMAVLKKAFEKHKGEGVEDQLWIFPTPADAICGAVDARVAVEEYNATVEAENCKFTVVGWGIHCGDLLFLHGTDIHWGDPVNTSSKLGQDLAENGDIIITPQVKDPVIEDPRCKDLIFEARTLQKSNVDFECFCVQSTRFKPVTPQAPKPDPTDAPPGEPVEKTVEPGEKTVEPGEKTVEPGEKTVEPAK